MDHQIGLVVRTVTTGSAGTRWFDVETRPSNEDAVFAVKPFDESQSILSGTEEGGDDEHRDARRDAGHWRTMCVRGVRAEWLGARTALEDGEEPDAECGEAAAREHLDAPAEEDLYERADDALQRGSGKRVWGLQISTRGRTVNIGSLQRVSEAR